MDIEIIRTRDVVFPQGLAKSISGVMGKTFERWLHAIMRYAAGRAFYYHKADRDAALEVAGDVADEISEAQKVDENFVDGSAPIDKLIRKRVKWRLIDRYRKEKGTLQKDEVWQGETLGTTTRLGRPDWDQRANELILMILEALFMMPEKRRDAFLLIIDQGLTRADAAKTMGVKLDNFKYHYNCSLRDMKRALKGQGVFDDEIAIITGQSEEAQ